MSGACSSMTGYGCGEVSADGLRVTTELRSVNHRFLDLQFKLPRCWASLEPGLNSRVRERLGRGRVEVYVKRDVLGQQSGSEVRVDADLAQQVHAESRQLAEQLGVVSDLSMGQLLRIPGVLDIRDAPVTAGDEAPYLEQSLDAALDALCAMRAAEGASLAFDLGSRLSRVATLVSEIRHFAQGQSGIMRERLEKRIEALVPRASVDPSRIAQEVALLVDKAAVDEELQRLDSHVQQARDLLAEGGPIGRRLDFLVQEMNREANTCGSKSGLEDISRRVVELKSEIEKIREQVANVE